MSDRKDIRLAELVRVAIVCFDQLRQQIIPSSLDLAPETRPLALLQFIKSHARDDQLRSRHEEAFERIATEKIVKPGDLSDQTVIPLHIINYFDTAFDISTLLEESIATRECDLAENLTPQMSVFGLTSERFPGLPFGGGETTKPSKGIDPTYVESKIVQPIAQVTRLTRESIQLLLQQILHLIDDGHHLLHGVERVRRHGEPLHLRVLPLPDLGEDVRVLGRREDPVEVRLAEALAHREHVLGGVGAGERNGVG